MHSWRCAGRRVLLAVCGLTFLVLALPFSSGFPASRTPLVFAQADKPLDPGGQARLVFPAGPLPLAAYPRPPQDNGRGVCWFVMLGGGGQGTVDTYVPLLSRMHIRWTTFLTNTDRIDSQTDYLVDHLVAAGIEPVLRIYTQYNSDIPQLNLSALVAHYQARGVYYYEIGNEPNLTGVPGGWHDGEPDDPATFLRIWVPAATQITAAGGLPGLPGLAPGSDHLYLAQLLAGLRSQGQLAVLDHAWLGVHNYTLNHPLFYSKDSDGFLKFRAYDRLATVQVGRELPVISTEGGSQAGQNPDEALLRSGYAVTDDTVANWTVGMYSYMSHAEPYYFAVMPWLIGNAAGGGSDPTWEAAAWIKANGTSLPVVAAVSALPDSPRLLTVPIAAPAPALTPVPTNVPATPPLTPTPPAPVSASGTSPPASPPPWWPATGHWLPLVRANGRISLTVIPEQALLDWNLAAKGGLQLPAQGGTPAASPLPVASSVVSGQQAPAVPSPVSPISPAQPPLSPLSYHIFFYGASGQEQSHLSGSMLPQSGATTLLTIPVQTDITNAFILSSASLQVVYQDELGQFGYQAPTLGSSSVVTQAVPGAIPQRFWAAPAVPASAVAPVPVLIQSTANRSQMVLIQDVTGATYQLPFAVNQAQIVLLPPGQMTLTAAVPDGILVYPSEQMTQSALAGPPVAVPAVTSSRSIPVAAPNSPVIAPSGGVTPTPSIPATPTSVATATPAPQPTALASTPVALPTSTPAIAPTIQPVIPTSVPTVQPVAQTAVPTLTSSTGIAAGPVAAPTTPAATLYATATVPAPGASNSSSAPLPEATVTAAPMPVQPTAIPTLPSLPEAIPTATAAVLNSQPVFTTAAHVFGAGNGNDGNKRGATSSSSQSAALARSIAPAQRVSPASGQSTQLGQNSTMNGYGPSLPVVAIASQSPSSPAMPALVAPARRVALVKRTTAGVAPVAQVVPTTVVLPENPSPATHAGGGQKSPARPDSLPYDIWIGLIAIIGLGAGAVLYRKSRATQL